MVDMNESHKMTTAQQDIPDPLLVFVKTNPNTGEIMLRLSLPASLWIALYRSLKSSGRETTVSVATLGAMISHALASPSENQEAEAEHVAFVTRFINDVYNSIMERWHNEEEIALEGTYLLLKSGEVDHFRAAQIARKLLGIPVTATAWRLRVSRWAKKKGREPVDLPRGRSRKNKPSDAEE